MPGTAPEPRGGGAAARPPVAPSNPACKPASAPPPPPPPPPQPPVYHAYRLVAHFARAMFLAGAPLYRIELRVLELAVALHVPITIATLPSAILLALGGSSSAFPPQAVAISGLPANNMEKLQDLDRWVRSLVGTIETRSWREVLHVPRPPDHGSIVSDDEMDQQAADQHGLLNSRADLLDEQEGVPQGEDVEGMDATRSPTAPVALSAATVPQLERLFTDLQVVVHAAGWVPGWGSILAHGFAAAGLASLWIPVTPHDIVATFLLGLVNGLVTFYGHRWHLASLDVIVPFLTGAIGQVFEMLLGAENVCFGTSAFMSCFSFYPGIPSTVALVEIASGNVVAGIVRIGFSFLRSVFLGFGNQVGSRAVIALLAPGAPAGTWGDIACMDDAARPNAFVVRNSWWAVLAVFFPLSLAVNNILRGHPRQWPWMTLSSALGVTTIILTSLTFDSGVAAALAGFVVGIYSHCYSRWRHDIGIACLYAGIFLFAPGPAFMKGSTKLLTSDLHDSVSFALDVVVRALSICIGLYLASLALFPFLRRARRGTGDGDAPPPSF